MNTKDSPFVSMAFRPLLAALLTLSLQSSVSAAPVPASSPTAKAPAEALKAETAKDKKWTLNHQNADIREFIGQIAKITGETFVIDPRIKGGNTVTVISSKPLSSDEVYDVFLEVLSANGYAVIPKGSIINIVPSTTAKTSSPSDTQKPRDAVMTTRVIELHSVSAIELIPIIRPLIAQYGHAAASASSNAVIVSDLADNVDRITKLVRELDETGNNDYEVLQLKHAWVGDVSKIIQDTLVTGKGQLPSGLQVIADERSNRLVIKGNASKRQRVRKLVETLDKEGIRKSNTKVIFLSYGDAKNIADILAEASSTIQDSQEKKAKSSASAQQPVPQQPSSPKVQTKGQPSGKSKSAKSAPNVFVKADETQNALIMIADPDTLAEMEHIVRQLDIPRSQVLLEAVIVEVSGGIDDALGVQWGIDGKKTIRGESTTTGADGKSTTTVSGTKSSVTGHILENSAITLGSLALRGDNFGVLVSALSAKSNNDILSTPSMLTLDNQEAEFLVGQNIPIKTGSYQTSAGGGSNNPFTTTDRKDVGIKLKITPHLSEGNGIRLELEQEVSSLDVGTSESLLKNDDLIFNNRTLKTTVLVDDGQTIVIGGLIENIKSQTKKKVPLLGDIPIIGNLFRYEQDKNQKRNLMLFIRPTIMRNSETLAKATKDRYSKLKVIQHNKKAPDMLPEDPSTLFEPEAFDLRKKDKKIWQTND
ncbi:type II secretion system secretin GspD [Endozoicomonas arenosclerae]|uniref:type II secretion system secretin GspD n=1 Tax=Endozoicomonas arenosclerae TaxID=1633495 RepID=UPI000784D899|nr:type II secretion system secretin GspD [Endozoicomonas arenosclerae]